jgi:hypothetical protein
MEPRGCRRAKFQRKRTEIRRILNLDVPNAQNRASNRREKRMVLLREERAMKVRPPGHLSRCCNNLFVDNDLSET